MIIGLVVLRFFSFFPKFLLIFHNFIQVDLAPIYVLNANMPFKIIWGVEVAWGGMLIHVQLNLIFNVDAAVLMGFEDGMIRC